MIRDYIDPMDVAAVWFWLLVAFGGLIIWAELMVSAGKLQRRHNPPAVPGMSPSVSRRVAGNSHASGTAPICTCSWTRCPWCGLRGPDYAESPIPSDYCDHTHPDQTADRCTACSASAGDLSGPHAANAAQQTP